MAQAQPVVRSHGRLELKSQVMPCVRAGGRQSVAWKGFWQIGDGDGNGGEGWNGGEKSPISRSAVSHGDFESRES